MNRPITTRTLLLPLLTLLALALALPGHAWQSGEIAEISAEQLLARIEQESPMLILDVRTPEEFAEGHVPGAVNIPHTELPERLEEVRRAGEVDIVVYCRSGRRAGIAEEALSGAGFERLLHLTGDMLGWNEKGLPTETPGS